jgi:hypothetical protein
MERLIASGTVEIRAAKIWKSAFGCAGKKIWQADPRDRIYLHKGLKPISRNLPGNTSLGGNRGDRIQVSIKDSDFIKHDQRFNHRENGFLSLVTCFI